MNHRVSVNGNRCQLLSCRFLNAFIVAFIASFILVPAADADLVGYWNFDDNVVDQSGTGNDGELVGAEYDPNVAFGDGKSLSFSADEQHVLIPADPSLDSDVFTLSMFINSRGQTGAFERLTSRQNDKFETAINVHAPLNGTGQLAYYSPAAGWNSSTAFPVDNIWHHVAYVSTGTEVSIYFDGDLAYDPTAWSVTELPDTFMHIGNRWNNVEGFDGLLDEVALWNEVLGDDEIAALAGGKPVLGPPPSINGGGETYSQTFDDMGTGKSLPSGWSGVTSEGKSRRVGLGLTDGFLTVPGSDDDGVLGVLNLGGNTNSFGPASIDGHIPTWTAELGGANDLFGRDDVIADNASDRALGVSRENNDDPGELNYEIVIGDNNLRAFVLDWDLEIWGGDPDGEFRSPEGPGMKVDVKIGGNSYDTMTENLLPGALFDSLEDEGDTTHNSTLIDGNVYSVRGMTTGIKEVSDVDGAVGNAIQINFNSNWNDSTDGGANGWISAIDNVQFRALAPGDADANGVVDVTDLLALLGGQKFNQGVDGVTWEQGDFNADDQFDTGDLLAMLSFLSGTFPSDPYASEAGGASDAVADVIVNSKTGEVTVDLAGHTVSAVIIESASEIFNGSQPQWDTTSQFPSTLPGELGNVLFTSTAAGVDELGVVISAEFLGRDKEFYLQDLDLNILIASDGGTLTKGNVIVVPEPSTWLMLGLGSLLLVGWRQGARRRSPGM